MTPEERQRIRALLANHDRCQCAWMADCSDECPADCDGVSSLWHESAAIIRALLEWGEEMERSVKKVKAFHVEDIADLLESRDEELLSAVVARRERDEARDQVERLTAGLSELSHCSESCRETWHAYDRHAPECLAPDACEILGIPCEIEQKKSP